MTYPTRTPRVGPCKVDGCDEPKCARGWCSKHYAMWRKHGDPLAGRWAVTHTKAGECLVEDCSEPRKARGLCNKHYRRQQRHGSPDLGAKAIRTYIGAHALVHRVRGRAADHTCECDGRCGACPCRPSGRPAQDWAYDHADPARLVDPRGRMFSLDPDHYLPMCRPCHRRWDRKVDRLALVDYRILTSQKETA